MKIGRVRLAICVGLLGPISACSGYWAGDLDDFEAKVMSGFPVGSSVSSLESELARRGYRKGGPAFKATPHRPEPLPQCLARGLAYGFWAGGHRFVCYRPEGGDIREIEVFQLVAGL